MCRIPDAPTKRRHPIASPGGSCRRRRLMRVGEQLRFGTTAKLSVSAPRPSSAPFGGTCPYPLCPFGTFPPDRGNRPRGEGKGCMPRRGACKSRNCQPAGGAEPLPYVHVGEFYVFAGVHSDLQRCTAGGQSRPPLQISSLYCLKFPSGISRRGFFKPPA